MEEINTTNVYRLKEPFASNFHLVDWAALSENPHSGAIAILKDNTSYITWDGLSMNPNKEAVDFVLQHLENTRLGWLAQNTNDDAVLFVIHFIENIDWENITYFIECNKLIEIQDLLNTINYTPMSTDDYYKRDVIHKLICRVVRRLHENTNPIAINWLKHNYLKYNYDDNNNNHQYKPTSPKTYWHKMKGNHTDEAINMIASEIENMNDVNICVITHLCNVVNNNAIELVKKYVNYIDWKHVMCRATEVCCSELCNVENTQNDIMLFVQQNIHKYIDEIVDEHKHTRLRCINWYNFSKNPCDAAIAFVREHLKYIDKTGLSMNSHDDAIALLKEHPEFIDDRHLIYNENPLTFDMIVSKVTITIDDLYNSDIWVCPMIFEDDFIFK